MIYGYCRISTAKQSIDRQIRNILKEYPSAHIIKEVFTGTKFQGRREMEKLLKILKPGDMIVFDSVSRMSRDAAEGFDMYRKLYEDNISLVFLKEPHINTEVFRKALENTIPMTGTNVDYILSGINKYLMVLCEEQIKIAFEQSEKEVEDLHQRTKEGIITAKLNGKQIGQPKGAKLVIKKEAPAKELIKKHNKTFGGPLTDEQTWKLCGICKTTYYKYKKELIQEYENNSVL